MAKRPLGNIEELLSQIETFNLPNFYVTGTFNKYIRPLINKKSLLGEGGAASSVYALDLPGMPNMFVIKQTSPCEAAGTSDALARYCDHIKDPVDAIRRIPQSDKEAIEMPNYIMEAIIGGFLHRLSKSGQSYHFASIYGIWVDPTEQRAYTLMRRYNTDIQNIIKSKDDVYIILFQVAHALSVAQERYNYTHYDLHGENLLYEMIDNRDIETIRYPIIKTEKRSATQSISQSMSQKVDEESEEIVNIRRLYVKNNGYLAKISDQGLARMETADTVINARVDDFPIKTEGLFNPSYDIACIVHYFLMKESKLPNPISEKAAKVGITDEDRAELYNIVFNHGIDINANNVDDFVRSNYMKKWWRPLEGRFIRYLQTKDMHTIVRKLGQILIERKLAVYYDDEPSNKKLQVDKITISPSSVIFKTAELVPTDYRLLHPWLVSGPYKGPGPEIYTVAPGITITSNKFSYREGINPWEWTPTKKELRECAISSLASASNSPNEPGFKLQYIHHVYVDLKKAQKAGYEFKLDCCKLDPLNYMKDHFGVTINGSFFDVVPEGTSKPIGPFKMSRSQKPSAANSASRHQASLGEESSKHSDNTFMSNLPIPAEYKKYYRFLNIKDGKLSIDKQSNPTADHFLVSGPILVEDGNLVVTEELLNANFPLVANDDRPIKAFQCSLPKEEDEKKVKLLGPKNLRRTVADFSDKGYSCVDIPHNTDNYVFNCEKINPGELSHASNPNPRSMLVLRDNKDGKGDVVLVYIEGRDDRGMGADLRFLANYAKKILGAHSALNLDGGRSSAIAWRTEDSPDVVKTANVNHKDFYPVGNLISLVKR